MLPPQVVAIGENSSFSSSIASKLRAGTVRGDGLEDRAAMAGCSLNGVARCGDGVACCAVGDDAVHDTGRTTGGLSSCSADGMATGDRIGEKESGSDVAADDNAATALWSDAGRRIPATFRSFNV